MVNWTPGPARCRSPEYEVEIAFADMEPNWPYAGRYRKRTELEWELVRWNKDGLCDGAGFDGVDLMPPTITREALAEEILCKFAAARTELARRHALQMIDHVINAVKAGRVE